MAICCGSYKLYNLIRRNLRITIGLNKTNLLNSLDVQIDCLHPMLYNHMCIRSVYHKTTKIVTSKNFMSDNSTLLRAILNVE